MSAALADGAVDLSICIAGDQGMADSYFDAAAVIVTLVLRPPTNTRSNPGQAV